MKMLGLAALLGVAQIVPTEVLAAAASIAREVNLPKVCRRGPLAGESCTDSSQCDGAFCVVDYLPRVSFTGTLTLVVDDDVSKFDGTETVPDVVAATVLLEMSKGGRRIISQTYQNLDGADLATLVASLQDGPEVASNVGEGRRLDETQLNDEAADPVELLDAFVFQGADTQVADALRAHLGASGIPVVTKVLRPEHFDEGASGLASVVRVRIQGKFLAP